jgi:hypothetical protein
MELLEKNTLGFRAGLVLNPIWDTRDYILSSSSGSFINLSAVYYGSYLKSEYDYYTIRMDARTHLNPVGRRTLVLRGLINFRGTREESLSLRDCRNLVTATLLGFTLAALTNSTI